MHFTLARHIDKKLCMFKLKVSVINCKRGFFIEAVRKCIFAGENYMYYSYRL